MKWISHLAKWAFNRKTAQYWMIAIADCVVYVLSGLLVYTLEHGWQQAWEHKYALFGTVCFYLIFYVIGFRIFRTYSGVIRYSSFIDLQKIGSSALLGLALSILVKASGLVEFLLPLRFSDLIFTAGISVMLMWALRIGVKSLFERSVLDNKTKNAFIYGVKNGGISLAKNIRNSSSSPYRLMGFVSDGIDMSDKLLMGVRVFPNDGKLIEEMKRKDSNVLIVSPLKNEALRENEDMVARLKSNGIQIFVIPEAQEWDGKSDLHHNQLREIEIEDLLPREKIEVDLNAIGQQLNDKRILVTGAAGSIGSEIVRQVTTLKPSSLIIVDQAETPMHDVMLMLKGCDIDLHFYTRDISNERKMREIFEKNRPEYVFHAAAYKHVPMMEIDPAESITNNILGTKIIADLAVEYGASKFVMVSTDKAVNPTNVMGCSKRICEIYVQSLDNAIKNKTVSGETQFVTTRFGNVLGSNGSVIPLFKEQIKNGGPITVTHPDIVRYFMLIPEACRLVLEAGTMGKGGEIFVFDMGNPVKISDLAKRMIALSGAKNIEIKYTGLRDGEKLYEEVLNDLETTKPTINSKIKIAQVREYEYTSVNKIIQELIETSYSKDDMEVVRMMKKIVPEFKSKHSKYETLDN